MIRGSGDRRRKAYKGRRGRARGRVGGGRAGGRGGRGEQERGTTAEHGHDGRYERDRCWPARPTQICRVSTYAGA